MSEIIAVEARFEADGTIRPLAFFHDGARYQVASLGRQWEQGDERHFLVMTPSEQVYELVYQLNEGCWKLQRQPKDFQPPMRVV
jgi:hypothetical protein